MICAHVHYLLWDGSNLALRVSYQQPASAQQRERHPVAGKGRPELRLEYAPRVVLLGYHYHCTAVSDLCPAQYIVRKRLGVVVRAVAMIMLVLISIFGGRKTLTSSPVHLVASCMLTAESRHYVSSVMIGY
jgi:hypothetical protein